MQIGPCLVAVIKLQTLLRTTDSGHEMVCLLTFAGADQVTVFFSDYHTYVFLYSYTFRYRKSSTKDTL